jgi:protein subunit release factor A
MLNKAEVDALMKSVADVMRDYVSKEVSEVRAEVKAVWAEFNSLPVPKDGKDGVNGKDGESPDVQEIVDSLRGVASGMVSEGLEPFAEQIKELQEQVESLPAPQNGVDGKDGKDADIQEVRGLITLELEPVAEKVNGLQEQINAALDNDPLAELAMLADTFTKGLTEVSDTRQ